MSRTGTTSLTEALAILGFSAKHYPSPTDFDTYEALTDAPVAGYFEELDVRYPNSKFILTTRELEAWVPSVQMIMSRVPSKKAAIIRKALYGCSTNVGADWPAIAQRHHQRVRSYFQDRSDLLILPLEEKDKWPLLCEFLGKEIPAVAYPWKNRRDRSISLL